MAVNRESPRWTEIFVLENGSELLIRPIRREDAEPLRATFYQLQPEAIRQRFLYTVKDMSPEMAIRLVSPDPEQEFALVATGPGPAGTAAIMGVARVALEPGTRDAEFAILVHHQVAGMGLGRHLMRRIIDWSREQALDVLIGDVLESNVPMLKLVRTLGFVREHSDTPGLARVTLDLAGPE